MQKIILYGFIVTLLISGTASAQTQQTQQTQQSQQQMQTQPAQKQVVIVAPRENIFPNTGFAGIGTLEPTSPLEIKKNAGNTRSKNFLLKLSNDWASNGQNEPSIMFSNGELYNPRNLSFWSIGARVSGDNSIKSPQTFKISHKSLNDPVEKELFSIDSYDGRVKIGDVNTQIDGYKLYVEKGILTEKVKVALKNSKDWYDHVFNKSYALMPLHELDAYIQKNKHLPDIPTTKEVLNDGIDLGKMNALLLKKIEELTLYTIELKKELDETKKRIPVKK